jgi:hypothetical protein
MMDTVLNLGMNDVAVEAIAKNREIRVLHGIRTAVLCKCLAMWFWK